MSIYLSLLTNNVEVRLIFVHDIHLYWWINYIFNRLLLKKNHVYSLNIFFISFNMSYFHQINFYLIYFFYKFSSSNTVTIVLSLHLLNTILASLQTNKKNGIYNASIIYLKYINKIKYISIHTSSSTFKI